MTGCRSPTLVLFDIDGTLLHTDGAGRAAMAEAAARLFDRPDLFEGLSFAGAVDGEIVRRALAAGGLPPDRRRLGRFRATYLRALRRRMARGGGRLCPGVPSVLDRVAAGSRLGLLTGNWREGARIKLSHFGLWARFRSAPVACGEDAMDRDGLLPVAWWRARRADGPVRRVIVVGDTPADVRCARAGAAALSAQGVAVHAVAVCTGFAEPADLAAAEPDLLLPDLWRGRADLDRLIQGTGA